MLQYLRTEFEGDPTWYVWHKTKIENITMDCLYFYGNSMGKMNWQDVYNVLRHGRPQVVQDIPTAFKSQIFKAIFDKDEYYFPLMWQMARAR